MSAALRIVPDPAGDGADVLDEYEMFGHAAGWAESTIYARRRAVLQLAGYVGARPEDVTPRQFVQLAGHVQDAGHPGDVLPALEVALRVAERHRTARGQPRDRVAAATGTKAAPRYWHQCPR